MGGCIATFNEGQIKAPCAFTHRYRDAVVVVDLRDGDSLPAVCGEVDLRVVAEKMGLDPPTRLYTGLRRRGRSGNGSGIK